MMATASRINQNQMLPQSLAYALKHAKAIAKTMPAAQKYSMPKTYLRSPVSANPGSLK